GQTDHRWAVSDPGLLFDMYDAQAPHELRGEVPLLGRERGAPGERDSLGAIDDVPVRVLRDERVVARRFDVLSQLVEHEVPALLFPLRAARRAIHRRPNATRAGGELHRGRALWTESAFVDRTVGVSLDLEELGLSVHFLRVRDQRTADRAVRAKGVDFLRPRYTEVERPFLRGGDIEAEGIRKGNERHPGAAGGSELQEFTPRDFRHRVTTVLLPHFRGCKPSGRFLA